MPNDDTQLPEAGGDFDWQLRACDTLEELCELCNFQRCIPEDGVDDSSDDGIVCINAIACHPSSCLAHLPLTHVLIGLDMGQPNMIECATCALQRESIPTKLIRGHNKNNFGIIWTRQRLLHVVRAKVKKHLGSRAHNWCLGNQDRCGCLYSLSLSWVVCRENSAKKVKTCIATTMVRLAMFCICEALSYQLFERLVYEEHNMGVPVGNINHSDHFVQSIRDCAYDELKHRLRKFLIAPTEATGMPPVFALNADKMTVLHRTGQMVGIAIAAAAAAAAAEGDCLGFVWDRWECSRSWKERSKTSC